MNWGLRIVILYLSFVALIVTLVAMCFGEKVELVTKDYYKQELEYQGKIDAMNNANNSDFNPGFKLDKNNLRILVNPEFLLAGYEGEIYFFRPSDSSKDFKLKMEFNANGEQIISRDKFRKGLYKIQMSWVSGNKNYFKEEPIVVD